MSTWKFTGNPENWITAITRGKWALNEKERNISIWKDRIKPNDTVVFHSTTSSDYDVDAPSVIIGYAFVGEPNYVKEDNWWIQEIKDNKNYWPYVIPLKEIYLFTDSKEIDFYKPIEDKTDEQICHEIEELVKNSFPVSELNKEAKKIDPTANNFPAMGSASLISEIYENILLSDNRDIFVNRTGQDTNVLDEKISENFDEKLAQLDLDTIREQAKQFDNSDAPAYSITYGVKRVRKENQLQKRRIARMEGHTCQLCDFKYSYKKSNGKTGWIIEIDHIIEKSNNGSENIDNLIALCPNCHKKKTFGAIVIDKENKVIKENGQEIKLLHDNHLGW